MATERLLNEVCPQKHEHTLPNTSHTPMFTHTHTHTQAVLLAHTHTHTHTHTGCLSWTYLSSALSDGANFEGITPRVSHMFGRFYDALSDSVPSGRSSCGERE